MAPRRLNRSREVWSSPPGRTAAGGDLIARYSIRRLAWQPPAEITDDTVAEALRAFGAREWQIGLLLPALTEALRTPQQ